MYLNYLIKIDILKVYTKLLFKIVQILTRNYTLKLTGCISKICKLDV